MTDVIVLDSVSIDAATGEILDDIPGDRLGWMAAQLSKARANVKGWEQLEALLKQEIERLLIAAGVKSVKTPYGTPTLMLGRETVDADALREFIADYCREAPETELSFYKDCANGFNARRVKDWLAPGLGLEVAQRFIRQGKDYVQLNPPREQAPRKETT